MKRLSLKETATQYTTGRNRYGDFILTELGTLNCLYRDVSKLGYAERMELQNIQGIFWFENTATVHKDDIIGYDNQLYRIEGITKAKDLLLYDQIAFYKCTASLYRAIS